MATEAPAPVPLPTTARSAPAPLPATAPIPNSNSIISNQNSTPVPKLPSIVLKNRYFIHTQRNRHTQRYVIESYLKKHYNLSSISYGILPNKDCIFFWIQLIRYPDVNKALSLSINNNKMPCIAYIPTQGILCEKTRFALTLYNYYGTNAWKYTPQTFFVSYNRFQKKWNLSDYLKQIFKDKNVWITKTSTGSLGKDMYLFSGNSLKSLKTFLETNYTKTMQHLIYESKRFRYLEQYEKYINPNTNILLDSVIIQKYLNKPLLFDKYYKFDIRIY
eukprot:308314_1